MDIAPMTQLDDDPTSLRDYRRLVNHLTDRSFVSDDEFDVLAPHVGTAAAEAIWVPVVVSSRVVPRV